MKKNIKNETIIELFYKNKKIATEKRIVYESGKIEHKYLNPCTGKWVKYSTFIKKVMTKPEWRDLIKTWYYSSLAKPLFNYYRKVKAVVGIRNNEDTYSVVLGPWDKLIARVNVNPWTVADVTIRDEHHLVIETSYHKDDDQTNLDYAIETLETILKELKAKKAEDE